MNQQQPRTRLSRRNVMIAGGATVAAIGAFGASPLSNPLKARPAGAGRDKVGAGMLSLANGTYGRMASLVGATFAVAGGTSMRLAGVSRSIRKASGR